MSSGLRPTFHHPTTASIVHVTQCCYYTPPAWCFPGVAAAAQQQVRDESVAAGPVAEKPGDKRRRWKLGSQHSSFIKTWLWSSALLLVPLASFAAVHEGGPWQGRPSIALCTVRRRGAGAANALIFA